jgi:putative transposase
VVHRERHRHALLDPGSPWQNGIVESFNGRLRDGLLSYEIFDRLAEARYLIDRWRLFYNHQRIQRALGKLTPAAFAAACAEVTPLACAAAPPRTQGATTIHQLS